MCEPGWEFYRQMFNVAPADDDYWAGVGAVPAQRGRRRRNGQGNGKLVVGDCYHLKHSCFVAQIFNGTKDYTVNGINSYTVNGINSMINELGHFQYKEFTEQFREAMKRETPLVMSHINNDNTYDWDWDPVSKKFHEKLARKNARLQCVIPC